MASDDFVNRYAAIMRIALRGLTPEHAQLIQELGKELFTTGGTPEDALRIHREAIDKLKESGAHLESKTEILESMLDSFCQGWTAEWRAIESHYKKSLADLHFLLSAARRASLHRLRQLTRSNKLLLEEVLRRRRLEKRLRQMKTWLQRAQDLAQLGFWVHRLGTRELKWHGLTNFLQQTGGHPRAIRSIDDFLAWVHPDDVARVRETFGLILAGQKPEQIEFRLDQNGEVRFVRQDVALGRRKGRTVFALGVIMDITSVKLAEQASRQAERVAALGTLAAGIAHEINNPLGSAMLSAETALAVMEQANNNEILQQCLHNVKISLERCLGIVTSILGFARRQHGAREVCDLNAITSRCCELMHAYVEERDATLLFLPCEQELPVLACPLEIELAISNLLRNAVQSRTIGTRVTVKTERERQQAVVTITDNGKGMTLQEVNRMFDPFYTARTSEGGTGLGASLAFTIIRDHSGEIKVASAPGEGTTVRIILPVHPA